MRLRQLLLLCTLLVPMPALAAGYGSSVITSTSLTANLSLAPLTSAEFMMLGDYGDVTASAQTEPAPDVSPSPQMPVPSKVIPRAMAPAKTIPDSVPYNPPPAAQSYMQQSSDVYATVREYVPSVRVRSYAPVVALRGSYTPSVRIRQYISTPVVDDTAYDTCDVGASSYAGNFSSVVVGNGYGANLSSVVGNGCAVGGANVFSNVVSSGYNNAIGVTNVRGAAVRGRGLGLLRHRASRTNIRIRQRH